MSSTNPNPIPAKPAYVSKGQMLSTPPLTARINSAINTIYNAAGLYVTSLFSLDPYTAAQNSQFNTRGPGRNGGSSTPSGRTLGSGGGNNNSGRGWFGSGGGSGSGSGNNGGRRIGTVDDVRGPECGAGGCGR